MLKIAFVGIEGSGKTWLTNFFAQKYNTSYTHEYGNWYCENILNGYFKNNRFLTTKSDYVKIVDGQIKNNNEVLKKANKVCFFDSDYIFTKYFIDKQYVNWNWIDMFIHEQKINVFIFLEIEEIIIKKKSFVEEDTIQEEANLLLDYYQKLTKTKLIVVHSMDYEEQQYKVEKIVTKLLEKNEKKFHHQNQ